MGGLGSRLRKFGEQLREIVASWGGDELVQPSERSQPGREILVFLPGAGGRVHVGSLSKESGYYVFEYSPEFKEHPGLPRISAFRELTEPYRAKELWPFFRVRLPPIEREDVKRAMAELGTAPDDEFGLLGRLDPLFSGMSACLT